MFETFFHGDFSDHELAGEKAESGLEISVVVLTREAAGTIAHTVAELQILAGMGIVDQILVVDADSADGTAAAARDAGAEVLSEAALVPSIGPVRGKGDAMWRALKVVTGEIVAYVDGDVADFGRHYVTGLIGPLLDDSERAFAKGFYRRPFRQGETESVRGGGRVTELTAKPLLARCVPELIAFDQPLAGEIAVRRDVLDAIPFHTGYGVEIAMLVEVWNRVGLDAMVQVDLGTKRNAHQSLSALNGMASEVIAALAEVLDRLDRPDLGRIGAAGEVRTDPVVRPPFGSLAPKIT